MSNRKDSATAPGRPPFATGCGGLSCREGSRLTKFVTCLRLTIGRRPIMARPATVAMRWRLAAVAALLVLAVAMSGCGGADRSSGRAGTDPGGTGSAGSLGDGTDRTPADETGRAVGHVSGAMAAFCAALDDDPDGAAQREIWTEHRDEVLAAVGAALAGRTGFDALEAVNAAVPCLLAEPRGFEVDLMIVGMPQAHEFDVTAQQNIIAWRWQGEWHTELLQLPLDDPARVVLKTATTAAGIELLMAEFLQGTGGYGAFELYRAAATLERLWESDFLSKFEPYVLSDGRLLAKHRAPELDQEPHYFQGNCCQPVNGQVLYERAGDAYRLVAARLFPGVHYTVSLFAGALNAGDYELAASLVTDEALLQVLVAADGSFEPIELDEPPDLVWDIDYFEAWHWPALGDDGGNPHDVTEVLWPLTSHELTMVLRRSDGAWKVAGWE